MRNNCFFIWLLPGTELHFPGVILAVIFGFFFVVVASRIVGLVGSSSSPVSGMTIASILVSCLILIKFGASGTKGMISVMSIGTIVCIAICLAGDIANDLKTGYILGATPWKQQAAQFVGLFFSAATMGVAVFIFHKSFGFIHDQAHPDAMLAPQANIMAALVQGIFEGNLPWKLLLIGFSITLAVEIMGISGLAFAIGIYLPISLSTPIITGGLIAYFVSRLSPPRVQEQKHEHGILLSSGIIAGSALMGLLVAFFVLTG
ncbi:MAG: OPT/YSL family transporter, partial [bacterium]